MNNIKQKNIILGFKENNKIPYSENDIQYYDSMALNEPIINNTLQQLRDNDLFIENEILHKTTYNIGPNTYLDNELSTDYTNGKKYWNISVDIDDVQIFRKKNKTITDTISCILPQDNGVSFIFNVGAYLFAGFSDGVKYIIDNDSTNDYTSWTMLIKGTPHTYLNCNEIVLFSVDEKIYTYKKDPDGDNLLNITSVEKSDNFNSPVKSIAYDKNTKKIFVGTDDGYIYESTKQYNDCDTDDKWQFEKHIMKNYIQSPINDLLIKSWNNDYNQTNYITALRGNNILRSNYESILLNEKWILKAKNISDIKEINGYIYVAVEGEEGGIYKLTDDDISDPPIIQGSIKKIFELDNEIYYLNDTDKKIYKLNNNITDSDEVYDLSSYTSINDFHIVERGQHKLLIVATNDKILGIYIPSEGTKLDVLQIDEQVDQVKASIKNDTMVIYAHKSDKLIIYNVNLPDGDIVKYIDTDNITNFNQKIEVSITNDCEGIYSYYGGNIVYVDGQDIKNLDDNRTINTFSSVIKKLFKNYNNIGNFMYMALTINGLYLVKKQDNCELIIPDEIHKNDITNVLIGNEYLFITTKIDVQDSTTESRNIVYILSQPYNTGSGNSYQCSYIGKAILGGTYDSDIQIFEHDDTIYIKQNQSLKKYTIQRSVDIQKLNQLTDNYKNVHLANCFTRSESLLSVDNNKSYYLTLSAGADDKYAQIINVYDKSGNPSTNQFYNHDIYNKSFGENQHIKGFDLYDNNYLIYSEEKLLQYSISQIDEKSYDPTISVDSNGVQYACYIDGSIYVSKDSETKREKGLYQVIDRITPTELTADSYTNVLTSEPDNWDAQGNIFSYMGNEVNVVTLAVLKDNNVTIVNDESSEINILPTSIQRDGITYTITDRPHITMCLNDGLYTSYIANTTYQIPNPSDPNTPISNNKTISVTQLNGYLDQGKLSKFKNDVLYLDNKYYSQIKRAFRSRNSLFIDDTGCYIDSYTYGQVQDGIVNISSIDDIYDEDNGTKILKPRSSQMINIYLLTEGETISSINSYGYSDIIVPQPGDTTTKPQDLTRGVVVINTGSKIKIIPVKLNNILECRIDNDSSDSYINIQPAQVRDIGVVKTYSVKLNENLIIEDIKNVCVKIDDTNTYLYCHIEEKIYKKIIDTSSPTINFSDSDLIFEFGAGNADSYMEQSQDGSIVVVYSDDTNKVIYDIDTHQIISTLENSNHKSYRALGNLAYGGFVEMYTDSETNIKIRTFEKRQDGYELYKIDNFNDNVITKILTDDNLLYYILNNKLYCQKYDQLISPTFDLQLDDNHIIKYNDVQDIIDFEVSDGLLYCLFNESGGKYVRIFNVRCINDSIQYDCVGTYSFNYQLNKIQTIGEIFSKLVSNGKTLLFRESEGKTINSNTTTNVWCFSTSEMETLGIDNDEHYDDVKKVWIDDSNNIFIYKDDNVYNLNDLNTSLQSDVKQFKPANEYFIYSTEEASGGENIWYLKTQRGDINLSSIGNPYKLYKDKNQLYLVESDGIYTPVYERQVILDGVESEISLGGNEIVDSYLTNDNLDLQLILSSSDGQSYWTYYWLTGITSMKKYDGVKETDDVKYKYFRAMSYGNTKLVYHNNGFYFSKDGISFADLSTTKPYQNLTIKKYFYIGHRFYLVLTDNTENKVLTFTGHKDNNRFFEGITSVDDGVILYKIMDIGNNQYLIKSNKGLYLHKNNNICKITNDDDQYMTLINHSFDSNDYNYYYSLSGNVYKSNTWQEISPTDVNEVFSVEDINTIYDLLPINEYTWLIATDKGLYKSNYSYDLINDLTYFDEKEANDIYKSTLSNDVSVIITNNLSIHTEMMHNDNSIVTIANEQIQDIDASKPISGNWYLSSIEDGIAEFSNDTITDIQFGDQTDNTLSVRTNNFIGEINDNKFNYIIKKYMSGMIELYILLDSTNTYYVNHINGAGASFVSNSSVARNNLDGVIENTEIDSSNISTLKTTITIAINKNKFDIKDVYECMINGCSLPLKIYQDIDEIKSRNEIQNMYQSLILQSKFVMTDDNLYTTDDNYHYFTAVCFGTDQQSIKMQFTCK